MMVDGLHVSHKCNYYNNDIGFKLTSFKYQKQIALLQEVVAIAHLLSWT